MNETPKPSKIDIIKEELQKPNLDEERVGDLTALLGQYEGAAKSQLMTHTARMADPAEAKKTTKEYMQELDSWFLDMFPKE